MRRALFALLLLSAPAGATGLYEGSVIVTGTDARGRPAGLGAALAQVLAKVSGNPALLDSPQVAALAPAAPGLVDSLAYLDRMSDLPLHDEQGTRDRPYDLLVRFNPALLDAMLQGLGETPWRTRPPLAVLLQVEPRGGIPTVLHADTPADDRHRAALLDAADHAGLQVALPLLVPGAAPLPLPDLQLRGTLTWQEGQGWAGAFTLPWRGRDRNWTVSGVGFDAAYRAAIQGTVRVLSGHEVD